MKQEYINDISPNISDIDYQKIEKYFDFYVPQLFNNNAVMFYRKRDIFTRNPIASKTLNVTLFNDYRNYQTVIRNLNDIEDLVTDDYDSLQEYVNDMTIIIKTDEAAKLFKDFLNEYCYSCDISFVNNIITKGIYIGVLIDMKPHYIQLDKINWFYNNFYDTVIKEG